ncbi:MAG: hypothetical protein Q6373_026280 [Candidatus Sigynarchaeota archaeon]
MASTSIISCWHASVAMIARISSNSANASMPRQRMPAPVDLAMATCGMCNGPLSRVLSCPHCSAELLVDKNFFGTYGGSQIACATCAKQFLLKFD